VEWVEEVCRQCASAKVLVLTMHDDPAYLRAALSAGASGYVVKKAADTELLSAIRAVHAGRSFVDARSHAVLLAPGRGASSDASPLANQPLSKRERIVLERLAEGHTNQAIAAELDVSVKTVESYRARMLRKLGLRSRADIVRYAVETGLLTRRGAKEPT
jgi:DNA-binding NarL/FixJ family response regulator